MPTLFHLNFQIINFLIRIFFVPFSPAHFLSFPDSLSLSRSTCLILSFYRRFNIYFFGIMKPNPTNLILTIHEQKKNKFHHLKFKYRSLHCEHSTITFIYLLNVPSHILCASTLYTVHTWTLLNTVRIDGLRKEIEVVQRNIQYFFQSF